MFKEVLPTVNFLFKKGIETMKNVKIISAVMAMALAASLSGCKDNATPPPRGF